MDDTGSESELDEKRVYPARTVHLLMKNNYRISRNIRAKWFLEHLNSVMDFKPMTTITGSEEELTVSSVEPADEEDSDDELPIIQRGEEFKYQILPSTVVTFLAKRYRLVFVLDVSPSAASVDLKSGELIMDKICGTLRKCVTGLVKPFILPSTHLVFIPELYVTVIAYTSVLACTSNQVLAQGVTVTEDNVEEFLKLVASRFDKFEQDLCASFIKINTQNNMMEDNVVGASRSVPGNPQDRTMKPAEAQTNNDFGIISLIRQGLFALQLLPENSSAGIVMVTDGMLGVPDAHLFDSIMTQLRNSTIACSFLKIGETYCARCQFGYIPHVELLQFIATATFGAYFSTCPDVSKDTSRQLNVYHKALLFWSFQKGLEGFKYELTHNRHFEPLHPAALTSRILTNPINKAAVVMPTVRKKHLETKLSTNIFSVLSVRLREGFTIKDVHLTKNGSQIEVRLVLPWKQYVKIEYTAFASWPMDLSKRLTHAEITIEGSYDFLHDITCIPQKIPWSSIRLNNVKRFWMALQRLRESDQLLVHLQSFGTNPSHVKVPDTIKSGVPVFHISSNSSNPVLNTQHNSKDTALLTFASFWKPVVNLDIKIWQKWMHSHKIGMILEHDVPLPKYLHTPNASGRFSSVLSRQALTSLNLLLREWSSFILIENHAYIKLIQSDPEKAPNSFLLLRVTSKPPCMMLRLAFLGGVGGQERYDILRELSSKVANLKFPKRGPIKVEKVKTSPSKENIEQKEKMLKPPLQREWSEINCCVLLTKPVEHILISYDKQPQDMTILEDPSCFIPSHITVQQMSHKNTVANAFNTLSRYLHHQRWIWTVKQNHVEMNMPVIGRILATLAKIRLQEGFKFASSTSGIVNMVVEVDMVNKGSAEEKEPNKCVVQYIMFPPYTKTTRDSVSEEDMEETTEADGEVQIVTECWIEPQNGVSTNNTPERQHWNGLDYKQIARAIYPPDLECIACLVTFEHLVYVCQNTIAIPDDISWLRDGSFTTHPDYVPLYHEQFKSTGAPPNIHQMGLPFDVLSLLPKSQQAEIKLSTYRLVLTDDKPDVLQDEKPRDIKGSNSLLLNLMFENLRETYQREVILSVGDCRRFLTLLKDRKRDLTENPFPFPIDDELDADGHEFKKEFGTLGRLASEGYYCATDSFKKSSDAKSIPLWRCFVRASSNTRLFFTFIPSSFDDLLKLNKIDTEQVGAANNSNSEAKSGVLPGKSPGLSETDQESVSTLKDETADDEAEVDSARKVSEESESNVDTTAEEQDENPSQPQNASCVIPIYVYECLLSNVTETLIDPWCTEMAPDLFEDLAFQNEGFLDESVLKSPLFRYPSFDRESTPGSEDKDDQETVHQMLRLYQERRMTDCAVDGTGDLSKHCLHLSELYYNSFVTGVFQSLQQNYPMDSHDIDAAINNICQESLPIETDITTFLLSSCQHFQQIVDTARADMMLNSKEFDDQVADSIPKRPPSVRFMEDQEIEGAVDKGTPSVFILPDTKALLKSTFSGHCENIEGLHNLICSKFSDIIYKWFKLVPNYPNYYFYCPEAVPQDSSIEEIETDDKNNTTEQSDNGANHDNTHQTSLLEFSDNYEKYSGPDRVDYNVDGNSVISNMDSQESFLGSEYDLCADMVEDDSRSNEPLFIHFTCTIKSRLQNENVSVQTLVPCLDNLLNPDQRAMELNLGDLKITFDINCMTLPYETEQFPKKPIFSRMMSSSSDVPGSPTGSDNDAPTSTEMGPFSQFPLKDPVCHLPHLQHSAVLKCKEELEWLLRDEIASELRTIYPIRADALHFVIDHIKTSSEKGKANCALEKVSLKFVYRPENSLQKFKEEFERLNYHGYRVTKEEDFYLVKGKSPSLKTRQIFGDALNNALMVELSREGTPAKQATNVTSDIFIGTPDINLSPECDVMTTYVSPKFISPSLTSPDTQPYRGEITLEANNLSSLTPDISGSDEITQIMSTKDVDVGKSSTGNESSESKEGQKEVVGNSKTLRVDQPVRPKGRWDSRERKRMSDVLELRINRDRLTDSPPTPPVNLAKRSGSLGEVVGEGVLKKSSSFAGFHTEDNSTPFQRQESLTVLSTSPIKASSGGTPQLPMLGRLRHWSAPSGQGTPRSKTSTLPQTPSWISSRGSYTEEGYDGDSSDTEDGITAFSDISGRQLRVPKFWLLFQVGEEGVDMYFHTRESGCEENEDKIEQRNLLTYFRKSIEDLCRKVNQRMLLDDLYEKRMCDPLLVPEADEEIKWNYDQPVQGKKYLDSSDASEGEDEDQREKSVLFATMDFHHEAGYFECECVKSYKFSLHPRLKSGQGKTSISRGMQALRAILNKFSVNNRKNMFVIKEVAGSQNVFYLRLKEVSCMESGTQRQTSTISADDVSLTDSSSSAMFAAMKKDDQGFLAPERDKDCDTISMNSMSSMTSKTVQDCIMLDVHGTHEPGMEIQENLIKMLQNKLDDAVLEMISLQLSRNPVSKLSSADVHFIQKPGVPPFKTLRLTIPSNIGAYLSAFIYYLKQNLLQFSHTPNYADNKADNKFQSEINGIWQAVEDDNVFLYIKPHAFGGKGIFCVSMCLTDERGHQIRIFNSPKPARTGYNRVQRKEDFDNLVSTDEYTAKPKPGLTSLIRFCIWERGSTDIVNTLQEKLRCAVSHALCDIVTEYHMLTASICPIPAQLQELLPTPSVSAPSSPITVKDELKPLPIPMVDDSSTKEGSVERRHSTIGRKLSDSVRMSIAASATTHANKSAEKSYSPSPLQSLKDAFTSKSRVTSPPPDSQKTFDFSLNSSPYGTPPSGHENNQDIQMIIKKYEEGERGHLHPIYSNLLKEWLSYCSQLGVPSVSKLQVNLMSKFSVDYFLKELSSAVTSVTSDIQPKVFKLVKDSSGNKSTGILYSTTRQPLQVEESSIESSLDCEKKMTDAISMIVIGRNVEQWQASIQSIGEEEYSEQTSTSSKAIPKQTFQKFPPLLNTTVEEKDIGVSPVIQDHVFIPRQRLLLLTLEDKELTLYLYNWARDLSNLLCSKITQLAQWHNSRVRLLESIVSQKMGLYHHCKLRSTHKEKEYGPYTETSVDHLIKCTAPPPKDTVHRQSSMSNAIREPFRLFDEAFKDLQPLKPLHHTSHVQIRDPVSKHGHQIQELRNHNKKNMEKIMKLNKLYWMWFGKNTANMNMPVSDDNIQLLQQSSRLFHYCATPLLFHPHWRQKVMEKYKVTQKQPEVSTPTTLQPEKQEITKTRSRHSSGTSNTSMRTKRADSQEGKKRPLLLTSESTGRQNTVTEETWHVDLRNRFLGEYIQYIQSLGFVLVQMRPSTPRKGVRHVKKPSLDRNTTDMEPHHGPIGVVHYLQKTSAAGIMMVELSFREQYFCVKLYTCEYTRLGVAVNQQVRLLFVEECEKCKDLIHVHSFAHDFHLRCIQSHITRQQVFQQNYHLTGFLTDFMQVYPYPPRFSRNFLHTDTKQIGPLQFSGQQLYDYMLQHVKLHDMKVVAMIPTPDAEDSDYHFIRTTEYALIQNKLTKAKVPKMDDYNVGLIVIHNSQQVNFQVDEERNMLKLFYFIVLTSNRELFPKTVEGSKAAFLEELKDCSKPVPVKQHIGVRLETIKTLKNPHVHNTPAYALLLEEADIARKKLENMVDLSIKKCRKDLLWQRMLVGDQYEDDGRRKKRSETEESRDGYQKLSFEEFLELMSQVKRVPLGDLDHELIPLQNMSFQWYRGLFKVLQTKYPETHRCFSSKDGQVQYILILNPNFLDMFMMLMINNSDKRMDLCTVFRDEITDQEHTPENPSFFIMSMQSHVEDFVNVCCYHMWASMI